MLYPNAKRYSFAILCALGVTFLPGGIPLSDHNKAPKVTFSPTAHATTEEESHSRSAPSLSDDALSGLASWYGQHWQGRKTASGRHFNTHKLTAAHRSLPLNTRVRVTNLENNESVVVLINDRGPYVGDRVIDLSKAAARRLGMVKKGLAPVQIEIIGGERSEPHTAATGASMTRASRASDDDNMG